MAEFIRDLFTQDLPEQLLIGYVGTFKHLVEENSVYNFFDYLFILKTIMNHGVPIPAKIHNLVLMTEFPPENNLFSPYEYIQEYLRTYNLANYNRHKNHR